MPLQIVTTTFALVVTIHAHPMPTILYMHASNVPLYPASLHASESTESTELTNLANLRKKRGYLVSLYHVPIAAAVTSPQQSTDSASRLEWHKLCNLIE
eukprot:scaffold79351_cov46-Attheya_sp.AAC.1